MYVWDSIWAMSSYWYIIQRPKEFSCKKLAALCALCYRHSHHDRCVGDILCSDIGNRRLELKFTDCPCENSVWEMASMWTMLWNASLLIWSHDPLKGSLAVKPPNFTRFKLAKYFVSHKSLPWPGSLYLLTDSAPAYVDIATLPRA